MTVGPAAPSIPASPQTRADLVASYTDAVQSFQQSLDAHDTLYGQIAHERDRLLSATASTLPVLGWVERATHFYPTRNPTLM